MEKKVGWIRFTLKITLKIAAIAFLVLAACFLDHDKNNSLKNNRSFGIQIMTLPLKMYLFLL